MRRLIERDTMNALMVGDNQKGNAARLGSQGDISPGEPADGVRTVGGWWRAIAVELGYPPFLVLLGLGFLVRLSATLMYFPAWLQSYDEVRYSRIVPSGLFNDYWMPAGYAFFARGMRAVFSELWVTIAVQHVVGLTIGVALFLAMRRLGVRAWLACVPAGVAFLSGDQIWIEHQVVAETFLTASIALGLAAVVRGLVPVVDYRWLALGSLFLMYGGLTRNIGLAILPVVTVIALLWVKEGGLAVRARLAAAMLAPALCLFGLYFLAFQFSGGQYLGIGDMSGWNLYSRVAPFADCNRFEPPSGTRKLCEKTPPSGRDGSLGYSWDLNSRGRQVFELGPDTDPMVGSFAKQVILHQPLSYLKAVATDAARYIDPSIGPDRPFSGTSHELQSFGLVDPRTREFMEREMGKGYSGTQVRVIGRDLLATYQNVFRLSGLALVILLILSVIGVLIGSGTLRLGIFLYGSTALLLYLIPVAALSWEVRYGLPPQPFLVASGVIGLAALLARRSPVSHSSMSDDSRPTAVVAPAGELQATGIEA